MPSELLYARELVLPASRRAKIEALREDRRLLDDTYHEASKAIDREIEELSKRIMRGEIFKRREE